MQQIGSSTGNTADSSTGQKHRTEAPDGDGNTGSLYGRSAMPG